MATMNFVRTRLMPGVQSIEVLGEGSMGNWVPVDKVVEGRRVKFTVTTYPNFTLTSWRAYYADVYGDIIDLQLTSVTGESSWIFTMPDSLVMILCEASGSGGGDILPPYQIEGYFIAKGYASLDSLMEIAVRELNARNVDVSYPPTNYNEFKTYVENILSNNPDSHFFRLSVDGFNDSSSLRLSFVLYLGAYFTLNAQQQLGVFSNYSTGAYTNWFLSSNRLGAPSTGLVFRKPTFVGIQDNSINSYVEFHESCVLGEQTPSDLASIRYILSPTESGEIDISAPSELTGESSFTFKYRIKANYVFKRLTPFAINNVYYESEIVYAIDSYDGDTRTYTFTVSQIPEGATGVNVVIEAIRTDDPNDVGGTNASDTSVGGDGTYDDSSDSVPLPAIPSGISASDSGLVTLFRPSISQVKDFGNYLWSHITEFWENLQKIFTSPMDYVIAFNIFPVTPTVGADRDIYIGNWLSNIQMPPVLNQFYEFNAGTIQVKKYFGSFLDYYPNTRARIMLPFIGDREININEIMGESLQLWYRIDLLSGACVAILNVNDNVYYQWSGNCAVAVPVTGSDWSRLYSGIARAGLVVGSTLAFGPAGAVTSSITTQSLSGIEQATAVSAVSDSFANLPKGVPGVSAMRRSLTESLENINEPRKTTVETHSSKAIKASTMVRAVGYNVMGGSNRAQHTGDMSGAITIMGNRTPYLVLEYPDLNLPENYKHIFGYPSNQYAVLGNLSGYTKCKEVMFESTTATDDEIEMIISALKGGVYL